MSKPTNLYEQLRRDEGYVESAYKDSLGYYTIGIGFLIDERKGGGLREEEIEFIFHNRMNIIRERLMADYPWMNCLSGPRQAVFLNMAYQLGVSGLANFTNTLSHAEKGNWKRTARGMKNSLWFKQTPNRAKRLIKQIKTNEWQ